MRWREVSLPRYTDPTYVYDPVRDRTVVFGANPSFRQTVEYDTTNAWVAATTSPTREMGWGGAAYDPTAQRVVCYDGATQPQTWVWNGAAWATHQENPDMYLEHFVTHEGRGRVLAVGGFSSSVAIHRLFEWQGAAWVQVPTPTAPPLYGPNGPLQYFGSAYDVRRDKYVLFSSGTYTKFGYIDLAPVIWEWDATNGWVERTVPFPGTLHRWNPRAETRFDSTRGTILTIVRTGDRWPTSWGFQAYEWDGGPSWRTLSNQTPPPLGIGWSTLTTGFDERRGQWHMQFRGSGQFRSYFFESVRPATFEVHGSGCAGSLGQSELRLRHSWTRAWLGQSLETELTNLPTSTAIVAVGCDDQHWAGTALPRPLDPIGMPGCLLRVPPESIYAIAGSHQRATLSLPVPLQAALLGTAIYQQGFAIDPAANSLGLTATNSVRATVGR